ncbi:class I SAM-dependent methyltransferase [Stieleria varia]|uniref:Bifunctional 3-demethylubiquinone-9 3-methyltransferase/ 2-octaprenyl-6-hydroxy phenol methylase n=1 Tax=Stieleria varia TaxID=2528005 RepID=A0A5C6B0S0_9BACT|nr:methyltransferase domain-containing protein [Stieleria varia]TWU04992.1 bifunctional 3-demethylubiquinone-9 3-methyltransferase/ 2-octaprenyl-6-hydroxy phenol methylase [Stieleria varia]
MTTAVQNQSVDNAQAAGAASWRLRVAVASEMAVKIANRLPAMIRFVVVPIAAVIHESVTLGILRPSDVDRMVEKTYSNRPKFYDPREYQLPYEGRLLPMLQELSRGKKLLDAFCGQGREAELFVSAGFNVTAIDRLAWMIEAGKVFAQEKQFDVEFIATDFWEFVPERPFDVVYTSCWMYSTCQGRDRRAAFLQKCKACCSEDGVIVLSTVERSSGQFAGACLRFLLVKCVALATLGNLRSEFGERTYSGLFWHHLSESVVRKEVAAEGLLVLRVMKGTGIDPTFYLLSRLDRVRDGNVSGAS